MNCYHTDTIKTGKETGTPNSLFLAYWPSSVAHTYNRSQKYLRKIENRQKTWFFPPHIKCLIFNGKPKEAWKRVWSRSLGSRPLRTSGFNEFKGFNANFIMKQQEIFSSKSPFSY